MSKLCLIKVLHYGAQKYTKRKKYLECKDCVFREKCKERE